MIPWRHYVYIHRHQRTGEPFYVGKGTGNRAYSKRGRNARWQKTALRGYRVEIFAHCQTDTDAFRLETSLILDLRTRGTLTNILPGGNGRRVLEPLPPPQPVSRGPRGARFFTKEMLDNEIDWAVSKLSGDLGMRYRSEYRPGKRGRPRKSLQTPWKPLLS